MPEVGLITTTIVHSTVTDAEGNGVSNWFGRMFLREHWTRKND